ncbi:hypothetical protein N865_08680 [Intrasporangium oryzae NRRL B-24470]|uniref:Transglycosylase SLT domain-containing protein n=1 Tax=Intrasporangium oryzae NRRL B-24470 TaxID=1386089 RepID=W9G7Y6_9MICO|nr:lytic transglycosylase domain-containing protein [Intrasporangium oryzae]EWT01382.1 hypothetical protein N865_08680 [Intrasporangium oryzae NRRL B-24470]
MSRSGARRRVRAGAAVRLGLVAPVLALVVALVWALVGGPAAVALTAGSAPADATATSTPTPSSTILLPSPWASSQPNSTGTTATTGATPSLPPGSVVGGFGAITGASVSPLYDRLRLAAAYIVAARTEPGGGSSGADWKPPADLRTPTAPPSPAARPGPAGPMTQDQLLWAAYSSAADALSTTCHLPVTLLAAIGEVESSSLRGRRLDSRHDVVPPVIGPALSGGQFASVRDTDGGRLDGDPVWDHAVGPMQFIPATWRIWGADGNGDGVADPENIEDAALTAGRYLCAGGRDLSRRADLQDAILSYNHSQRYLATVLGLVDAMTNGVAAGP